VKRARYAPEAEADVYETAKRIAEESGALEPAYRFIDTIDEHAQLVATHPEMGRVRRELGHDLRSWPVGAFVIFYRVRGKDVEIARVLRGSRDIPALF
jgi:toxin ParE1/3/4